MQNIIDLNQTFNFVAPLPLLKLKDELTQKWSTHIHPDEGSGSAKLFPERQSRNNVILMNNWCRWGFDVKCEKTTKAQRSQIDFYALDMQFS